MALNADIVGYSRLLADDPTTTANRLVQFERMAAVNVEEADGTLINFVGDNFMAVFETPEDALKAAIATTKEIETGNDELPPTRQMRFRMGIDQGDVVITEEGQHVGDALNIAARIQAIALPGGISVSGEIFKALDEPGLRFRSIGPRKLKNIPEMVQVYEFADLPAHASDQKATRFSLEVPSVAVLPIHTEGLEPSRTGLARPLMTDVVNRLAKIPNLSVINVTADTAEHDLMADPGVAVRYMLQLGMFEAGDELRVYAELIESNTINSIWSDRWDADSGRVFDVIDTVAHDIARALEVELIIGEPSRYYTQLGDAHTLAVVYQGWYELTSGTREGWRKSIELFESIDNSKAEGGLTSHALLAYAHWTGAAFGFDDAETEWELARAHADKGIELNDITGMSRMVIAAMALEQGETERALEETEAALELRPNCDVTFGLEASIRRYLGQWQQAVDLAEQAMDLTPLVKPWYPTVLASSYYVGERYEDAASTAEAVIEHQSHNLEALLVLTAAQSAQGLTRRATATADLVRDRFPTTTAAEWLKRNPFQEDDVIDRWRRDLAAAGLE